MVSRADCIAVRFLHLLLGVAHEVQVIPTGPTAQSNDLVIQCSETRPSSRLLTILVGGPITSDFSQARHDLPTASTGGLLSLKVMYKPNITREQSEHFHFLKNVSTYRRTSTLTPPLGPLLFLVDRVLSNLLPDQGDLEERPTISFICCEHIATLEKNDLDIAVLMYYVLV